MIFEIGVFLGRRGVITVAPCFHFLALCSHQISWTILGLIVPDFCIILGMCFLLMYLPLSRPIVGRLFTGVHLCLLCLFFGELSATRILLGKSYDSRTCTFFRKLDFSWEAIPKTIEMHVCFRIIFIHFSWRFRHRCPYRFDHRFFIESGSSKI